MGLVLPSIIDEALDLIGVNWPNVDEDDYFEMATSIRDFADEFEGHGGDAHKAVTRILSSSEGWAVESMQSHWSHVKTSHLEKIPEVARLFADACDGVGQIIRGMKVKAGVELGVLAGTIVAELAATPLTLGISAAAAAGEIALMRTIVKRLIDEAVDQIVDALIAKVTEPVTGKLQELISDMVLDLAEGAFHPGANPGGMQLASAGGDSGGSGSGGKKTVIDHAEFEDGAGKVSRKGTDMGSQSQIHLGKSKHTFGRTKGKDVFTKAFDGILEDAIEGMEKAAKKVTHHVTDTFPERVKGASRHQKRKDHDVGEEADKVDVKKAKHEGDTPMYLLSDDGSIRQLHHDGTTSPVHHNDSSGVNNVLGDKAWYPWNNKGEKQRPDKPSKGETVDSKKVAPGSTELARATQLGRYANRTERPGSYISGGNYASALYDDGKGNRFILVGASGKAHSERSIGHPLIKKGHEGNVSQLYTEREPCQKNPKCDKYLAREFPDHLEVTHSAKYDQSEKGPDGTELSKYKKDREHRAYVKWLEDQWDQHGVAGGRTDTVLNLSPSDNKFVP
ncbi:nucleic acid/nucleotide deaminase domain-containing protein [Streptomyces sp. NPDC058755]|uniref:nucleic acid/nucleotide deaminase domain-containing protein n=1 Tax=Streptomyces sp. NPDC058755 TaxID=3346624 RepID=UPI0036ADA026